MNQSEFKANIYNQPQAQDNPRKQVTIVFFFDTGSESGVTSANQSQKVIKPNYLRHPIESFFETIFSVFSFLHAKISSIFQWCFISAAFLVICAGVWFYLITQSNSVMTYPAVVLLGFGFSSMVVNSLSFAADLIGENKVS